MAFARFDLNRRSFLKGAAASAALAAGHSPWAGNASAAAQGDAVSLEFWTPASGPNFDVITGLTDEFNATLGQEHGFTVNARSKNNDPGYVPYTTAMTSSGSPDVVMTYAYDPVVSWAVNGFIVPLDEYAQALGVEESAYFPIAWRMINFGGHIWGLLQSFDFDQFYWNTAIHTGAPPMTFEELDALAGEYTLFDDAGNLTQAGIVPWNYGSTVWNTLWGGSFYDSETREWTIDTPENLLFLEWFLKHARLLGGRDKSDALESSIPKESGDVFQFGKIAFSMQGEYWPANIERAGIEIDYGIAHPPTAPEVPYGTGETVGGNLFLLPTNARHPDEAALFIQYMTSMDPVLAWCVPTANLPPVKDAAFAPSFLEAVPTIDPWLEALQLDHLVPPNPSPQFPAFNEAIGTAIEEVTYQRRTPQEALTGAAETVAEAVAQFQQTHPDWEGE